MTSRADALKLALADLEEAKGFLQQSYLTLRGRGLFAAPLRHASRAVTTLEKTTRRLQKSFGIE